MFCCCCCYPGFYISNVSGLPTRLYESANESPLREYKCHRHFEPKIISERLATVGRLRLYKCRLYFGDQRLLQNGCGSYLANAKGIWRQTCLQNGQLEGALEPNVAACVRTNAERMQDSYMRLTITGFNFFSTFSSGISNSRKIHRKGLVRISYIIHCFHQTLLLLTFTLFPYIACLHKKKHFET